MNIRPLHDWLLVELVQDKGTYGDSALVRVGENPVRVAKVLAAGSGKLYKDVFVPTCIELGTYVAFFVATSQTQAGKAVTYLLPDKQLLIRETDVLFVGTKEMDVSI